MRFREETVTSKSNPTVMKIRSLTEKKYRDEYGLFRTDGIKLAGELFARGISPELVLLRESSRDRVLERLGKNLPDCEAVILSDAVFDRVSEEKSPEGIICAVKHLDNHGKIATINKDAFFGWGDERVLLLESVRDPGNLGTVIRSAAAFGTDRLVISSDCADIYNPKTVRASMGTLFEMKVTSVDDLAGAIGILRQCGRRVFAAALDRGAVALDRMKLSAGDCFAVGNEGHGLSRGVLDACDAKVFIPISEGAESLNAAIAASILLWEQKRQLG